MASKDIEEYVKENFVPIITFTLLFLITNNISRYFRLYQGSAIQKLQYMFKNPMALINGFPISFNKFDLAYGFILGLVGLLLILNNRDNKKKYRQGVEHGSAEWGVPDEHLKGMYNEEDETKNILFTENIKMAIDNSDLESHEYHRNKNTIIVGGSGSGKTRFFVKPNIMQMNSDYVVTDPKGDILNDLGYMLRKNNYDIKILNLIQLNKSMKFNPLAYIKKEEDILIVVETLIKNTQGADAKDDFWVDTERLLYQALIGAMMEHFYPEEQNLGTLADLISAFETKENDENFVSAVDEIFIDIAEYSPNSFAVKQYNAFKIAAGETAKSILISCATRLAPINIPAVRNMLSEDELNIGELGNKVLKDDKGNPILDQEGEIQYQPTALFVIIPDTDQTYNFIASIMYSQMFNVLATKADTTFHGRGLPRHVRFLLDEFANIGEIPDFENMVAVLRSREMSVTPILQTLSQLKKVYKDGSDTIIGNCDTLVFLGGKEDSTLKLISEQLGKETIDDYNTSQTKSQSDSFSQNYSKLGRELMTPDELQRMERSKAIVMITNLRPFIDNKYDITDHPNYKYHGTPPKIDRKTGKIIEDEFWFDTDKYIDFQRRIKQNERNLIKLREKALRKKQKEKAEKLEEQFNLMVEEYLNIEKIDNNTQINELENFIQDENIKIILPTIEEKEIEVKEDVKESEAKERRGIKSIRDQSANIRIKGWDKTSAIKQ